MASSVLEGRFKGVAVVRNDASQEELAALKAAGVLGRGVQRDAVGVDHYRDIGALLQRLAQLELLANVQVQPQQLPEVLPLLRTNAVRRQVLWETPRRVLAWD